MECLSESGPWGLNESLAEMEAGNIYPYRLSWLSWFPLLYTFAFSCVLYFLGIDIDNSTIEK
jgi:hypothetical protein